MKIHLFYPISKVWALTLRFHHRCFSVILAPHHENKTYRSCAALTFLRQVLEKSPHIHDPDHGSACVWLPSSIDHSNKTTCKCEMGLNLYIRVDCECIYRYTCQSLLKWRLTWPSSGRSWNPQPLPDLAVG